MVNPELKREHESVDKHIEHAKEFILFAFVSALELSDQFFKFLIIDIITHLPIIVF